MTLEPVRLAMYCTGCIPGYQLPCFAGLTRDVFARNGLGVTMLDPQPGAENVRAVASGERDFCLTSVAHFMTAKRDDPQLGARFVFMVARQTHMAAFVVRGRPVAHGRPIAAHAHLGGASLLGDPASPFAREYRALLARLDQRPGPAVEMDYADIEAALAQGRGDVAADFVDLHPRFQAAAEPFGVTIDCLPFHEAGIDVYGSGLVTSTRLLHEEPDRVVRALVAFREALLLSRDDPELGLDGLLSQIPSADARLVVAGWKAGATLIFDDEESRLGTMSETKWRRTIDYHADAYGTPRELSPGAVFATVAGAGLVAS
ncbi:MAG: NitT/TauT family transport system substrate-binding protein [Solirubrobacteraceae bacterium]|jgi:ABC-type nitrate/sulfonate/bicarbonate transport system substrate-binding protein|nr:NitT/TauT family transport system substrate-binding protein [Solirubrobacteraceae bacterium]